MNCLPSSLDLDHGVLVRKLMTSSHCLLGPSQSPTPGDPVTLEFLPVPLYVAGGAYPCVLITDHPYRPNRLLNRHCRTVQQVGPRYPHTISGTATRVANPNYPMMSYRNSGAHYLHALRQFIYVNNTQRSIDSNPSKSPSSWTRFCHSLTMVT